MMTFSVLTKENHPNWFIKIDNSSGKLRREEALGRIIEIRIAGDEVGRMPTVRKDRAHYLIGVSKPTFREHFKPEIHYDSAVVDKVEYILINEKLEKSVTAHRYGGHKKKPNGQAELPLDDKAEVNAGIAAGIAAISPKDAATSKQAGALFARVHELEDRAGVTEKWSAKVTTHLKTSVKMRKDVVKRLSVLEDGGKGGPFKGICMRLDKHEKRMAEMDERTDANVETLIQRDAEVDEAFDKIVKRCENMEETMHVRFERHAGLHTEVAELSNKLSDLSLSTAKPGALTPIEPRPVDRFSGYIWLATACAACATAVAMTLILAG